MDFKEALREKASESGLTVTDGMLEKFEKYFKMLTEWNKKMNLTAITEPMDVIYKHFIDCMTLFKYADIQNGAAVVDVGTGAGFPGAVMAIYRSDLKITLIDSLNKRVNFLNELNSQLDLGMNIYHLRAEDGAKRPEFREKFDVVVSRAVAQLNILSEYCLAYIKVGGHFYAMKGPQIPEEAEAARNAVSHMGGKIKRIINYALVNGEGRAIADIQKIKPTSSMFPRQSGQIKSKPL